MGPLNIVVPMAGLGSRFAREGFTTPKPLIPVRGVPMIRLVIANVTPRRAHRFIFICQRAHVRDYGLAPLLKAWAPGCAIVELDGLTEGAACTVLAAEAELAPDAPMMIVNSDQWVDVPIDDYLATMDSPAVDGLIMTMTANDPKWSFAEVKDGRVLRVVEKEVISDEATVGIYNFARSADFVAGAHEMIGLNQRVNNEFYVAPVYNLLIGKGAQVVIHNIGSEGAGMYGLGIPSDLQHFLTLPVATKATAGLT